VSLILKQPIHKQVLFTAELQALLRSGELVQNATRDTISNSMIYLAELGLFFI